MDDEILYCKSYAYSSLLDAKLFLIEFNKSKVIICLHNVNNLQIYIDNLDKFLKDIFFFEKFIDKYTVVSSQLILTRSNNARILLYPFSTDRIFQNLSAKELIEFIFTSSS